MNITYNFKSGVVGYITGIGISFMMQKIIENKYEKYYKTNNNINILYGFFPIVGICYGYIGNKI
jgi:hypothetical protein